MQERELARQLQQAQSREGSPHQPLTEVDEEEEKASASPSKRAARAAAAAAAAAEAALRRTLRLRKQVSEGRQLVASTPRRPSHDAGGEKGQQDEAAPHDKKTKDDATTAAAATAPRDTPADSQSQQQQPPSKPPAPPAVEQRAHKLDPTLFPASMPMHKVYFVCVVHPPHHHPSPNTLSHPHPTRPCAPPCSALSIPPGTILVRDVKDLL